MPLHFTQDELAERRAITTERMAAEGLDGMLLFRQESMYYLTGYDTFGYVPGNEFIIGSGPAARIGRYHANRRTLGDDDTLAIEFAGVYRHYHAALYRTIKIGARNIKHEAMHDVALQMLADGLAAIKPGALIGTIFTAFKHAAEAGGYPADNFAYGYGLGTTFAPNCMDWPMLYEDNPAVITPGMVLFLHPCARDEGDGMAAAVGETVLVTQTGYERPSKVSMEYLNR